MELIDQKLQTDLAVRFSLSLVMDSQSEMTKIMVIVQNCGNWDGPIPGKTVLCTIVGGPLMAMG